MNELSASNWASSSIFESFMGFCAKDEIRNIKSFEYSIENSDSISQFISYSLLAGSKIHFQKYFSKAFYLNIWLAMWVSNTLTVLNMTEYTGASFHRTIMDFYLMQHNDR